MHQPGCYYGVNSLPLAKVRDKKGNERFDINDRSTGEEIVEYYLKVAKQFEDCGRVQMLFNSEYTADENGNHVVTNITDGKVTKVSCKKVVTVHNNVLVPSMRGAPFSVDCSIKIAPVNDLPNLIQSKQCTKYVVIGAGKTGCDAITYLLINGIDQSAITWIISRDVWWFLRNGCWKEGYQGYKSFRKDSAVLLDALIGKAKTAEEVFLEYEKCGVMARLDPKNRPIPRVFKGPIIDTEELVGLRSIEDIVHLGRVTEITGDAIILQNGTVPLSSPSDTLIVDCMADFDGQFYGYRDIPEDFKMFEKERINLGPQPVSFNPSCSSAIIAYIESTFIDDDTKNNLFYFVHRKEDSKPSPDLWLAVLYCQTKTFEALGKYPPAMKFIVNSRTFLDAPMHHYNGMLGFLWALFGPLQLEKKSSEFTRKIENGGFTTVQDSYGYANRQLPKPNELKLKLKQKEKEPSNYPPKDPKPKVRYNCCATAEVEVIQ